MDDMKTIVVIDDDSFILELMELMLDGEYQVIKHDNGIAGLKTLRKTGADLVLLDWMMPCMYGMAVLREIRNDPSIRDIPVVMVSGRMDDDAKCKAIEIGAKSVLRKPFRRADLLAAVSSALAKEELMA